MKHDFIKNAHVEVIEDRNAKNRKIAKVVVDEKYEHTFGSNSRISKSLELMTPEDLGNRLSGGGYFFVDENLYDFREGSYQGFVQTDDTIEKLIDLLGISAYKPTENDMRVHENVTSGKVKLGRQWSSNPITIKAFKDGGEFKSELHYGWSPFMKTINSAFKLERLICTNGMRGMRNFMNTKIPLVNRWEEHLEIANIQIQNKVDAIIQRRFLEMSKERASVAELLAISDHALNRKREHDTAGENQMLDNIISIANPARHLYDVYQSHMFNKNSPAASQYPGHLTTMDAYNIATEVRSHTSSAQKSTNRALDMIANDLVFDHKNIILSSSGVVGRKKSSFSDPDAAFFGKMN